MLPIDRADRSQLRQQPVNRRTRYAGGAGQLAQLAGPVGIWKRTQQRKGTIQYPWLFGVMGAGRIRSARHRHAPCPADLAVR